MYCARLIKEINTVDSAENEYNILYNFILEVISMTFDYLTKYINIYE